MKSCVCNNMCYLEGTDQEKKNVDWETPFSCHCYNTNYSGGLSDQTRQLFEEEMRKIKERVQMPGPGVGFSQAGKQLLNDLQGTLVRIDRTQKELTQAISTLAKVLEKKL